MLRVFVNPKVMYASYEVGTMNNIYPLESGMGFYPGVEYLWLRFIAL